MSGKAEVFQNGILAGILEKTDKGKYIFTYNERYLADPEMESISLTLPKSERIFYSDHLFAYFFGLLAEGNLKSLQCRELRIDEDDHFIRLIKTAHADTIGCTTIREIEG